MLDQGYDRGILGCRFASLAEDVVQHPARP